VTVASASTLSELRELRRTVDLDFVRGKLAALVGEDDERIATLDRIVEDVSSE